MKIAATADLHFSTQNSGFLKDQLSRVRDESDVLVVAGDLTNFGRPEEMEPLVNVLVRLRVPTIAVLGNHDYESGKEMELMRMGPVSIKRRVRMLGGELTLDSRPGQGSSLEIRVPL